ncbi:MAG: hypothetical protein COV71_06565 [Candidatus Omnitrophica bacterium CG11_big_fil_rev_8_21_14_0_20_41_12]|nr:MAG: hypothetical protein COV71_06565 [Candidatus Omnitrophica bacterium CG11_big_fil_rev_8_21_14_0_20_41_12]
MRKLNSKEKILAASVGGLLILFALKIFVLGPINDKTNTYSQEIAQAKVAIRKYMALEHNRAEILKAQKQIEGYSSLKGSDEDKFAMVISRVEGAARKSKLKILDMNSSGMTKVKGGVTLYRVNLSAEGQLKSFMDFVSEVEGAGILLQIEKVNLSVKDESTGLLKIDVVILGVAFA